MARGIEVMNEDRVRRPVVQKKKERKKRPRPVFNPDTMGFGKHRYDHIDPSKLSLEFDPDVPMETRAYEAATNKPHPETTAKLEQLSRKGCIFETTAEGYPGLWEVCNVPSTRGSEIYIRAIRVDEVAIPTELNLVDLGVMADPNTNLYKDDVITKVKTGGKSDKRLRERLTRIEG